MTPPSPAPSMITEHPGWAPVDHRGEFPGWQGPGPPGTGWVTLAMLALAFLTVASVTERGQQPPPAGMIPLTREIAHLAAAIAAQPAHARHQLRWSAWRRRHQYRARACNSQHQAAHDP